MASAVKYLAFDLGAESGRALGASFDGTRLTVEELHRFPTGPVRVLDSLHWDVLRFWCEIQTGLCKAAESYGDSLASLGMDTWGVDFGLLAADDTLLGNPYHYRDSRTNGMVEEAFRIVPRSQIYAQTGIQFMQLNTLYQLFSMVRAGSPALKMAKTLLTIPDLFNFWLSGVKANEFTTATTTQCYDTPRDAWAVGLLDSLGIPSGLFMEVTRPGNILGMLRPEVAEDAGSRILPVVTVACHDTASAVACVPAEGKDFIYISSGTWSLIGVENSEALVNDQTLAYDFTNEGGINHTFRFLKNIMGMLLLQECRREWARSGKIYSYDDLTALAQEAAPLRSLLLPSDPRFLPHRTDDRAHPIFLPGDGPARAAHAWGDRPLHPGEPGDGISLGGGAAGAAQRAEAAGDPHHWRRLAQPAAQPVHRGCHRLPGGGRPGGGDRHRQCAGADDRPGAHRKPGGRTRPGAPLIRCEHVPSHKPRALGRGLPALYAF